MTKVRHLSDPAVAAYFLNAEPEDLLMDMNTFGLLFESLVIRDLRYMSKLREERYITIVTQTVLRLMRSCISKADGRQRR